MPDLNPTADEVLHQRADRLVGDRHPPRQVDDDRHGAVMRALRRDATDRLPGPQHHWRMDGVAAGTLPARPPVRPAPCSRRPPPVRVRPARSHDLGLPTMRHDDLRASLGRALPTAERRRGGAWPRLRAVCRLPFQQSQQLVGNFVTFSAPAGMGEPLFFVYHYRINDQVGGGHR
jgi:hypothetical protein